MEIESKEDKYKRLQRNAWENLKKVFPNNANAQQQAFDLTERIRKSKDHVATQNGVARVVLEALIINALISKVKYMQPQQIAYSPGPRFPALYGIMNAYKK